MRTLPMLLLFAACGGDKGDDLVTTPEDSALSTASGTETGDTSAVSYELKSCEELGYPMRPWSDGPYGEGLKELADDFTIETTTQTWTWSEQFSGCDSYLFIPSEPRQADGAWPTPLWDRDVRPFIEGLPDNVHVFFVSSKTDKSAADDDLELIQGKVERALGNIGPEAEEQWMPRIHYSKKRLDKLDNWVASYLTSPGWGFGIDRFQRIRDIGSFADADRYNDGMGWFEPNLMQASNEPTYYNFEAAREEALEADGATVVPTFTGEVVSDEGWAGVHGYVNLEGMPTDFSGFDTLELDMSTTCDGPGEYGICPAWDRIVDLKACEELVDPTNPHGSTECQPYVAPVTLVEEVIGQCRIDGELTTHPCTSDETCEGLSLPDTGDTAHILDVGPGDTGLPPTHCEGYVAPVDEVIEVAADTLPCSCTSPLGGEVERNYSCNGEGTGYNDCPCACDTEVGRWITTYHREGRWVHDASYALPFFENGNVKRLAFYTIDPWEITIDLRFSNAGLGIRPVETFELFRGGTFNTTYNDRYEPIELEIPATAEKVELSVVISGHGMESPGNCAEFCNTTHHFSVNGTENMVDFMPEVADGLACQNSVAEGTVPNQYGTWFYGRSNWCPGREVAPIVIDITEQVALGGTTTFDYEGFYNGEPYTANASIDLTSWVTVWE
jgi:hypothetical protein